MMSSESTRPSLWLVGTAASPIAWQGFQIRRFVNLPELVQATTERQPDLIVVAQDWSDEYRLDEVASLFSACPLTRILCCYGPLCASDGRSRTVWPAAVRVAQAELIPRLERELLVIQGHSPPLPLTAGHDELFAWLFRHETDW